METGNVSLNEERKRVCKRLLLDHHVVVGSKRMLYFVLLHICEFYSEEKKMHFIANFFSLTVQRRNNWESLLHLLCDFYVHWQKGSRKWQPWSRVRNSQISFYSDRIHKNILNHYLLADRNMFERSHGIVISAIISQLRSSKLLSFHRIETTCSECTLTEW